MQKLTKWEVEIRYEDYSNNEDNNITTVFECTETQLTAILDIITFIVKISAPYNICITYRKYGEKESDSWMYF